MLVIKDGNSGSEEHVLNTPPVFGARVFLSQQLTGGTASATKVIIRARICRADVVNSAAVR